MLLSALVEPNRLLPPSILVSPVTCAVLARAGAGLEERKWMGEVELLVLLGSLEEVPLAVVGLAFLSLGMVCYRRDERAVQ